MIFIIVPLQIFSSSLRILPHIHCANGPLGLKSTGLLKSISENSFFNMDRKLSLVVNWICRSDLANLIKLRKVKIHIGMYALFNGVSQRRKTWLNEKLYLTVWQLDFCLVQSDSR